MVVFYTAGAAEVSCSWTHDCSRTSVQAPIMSEERVRGCQLLVGRRSGMRYWGCAVAPAANGAAADLADIDAGPVPAMGLPSRAGGVARSDGEEEERRRGRENKPVLISRESIL